MGRFEGRVAIVTGGGRGIGRATALLLASEGARVTICARTAAEVAAVQETSDHVVGLIGDVGDAAFVTRLFAETADRFGRLDVLVANAAVLGRKPFADLEPALWDQVLAVNLRGAYLCARAAFRQMAAQDPA